MNIQNSFVFLRTIIHKGKEIEHNNKIAFFFSLENFSQTDQDQRYY